MSSAASFSSKYLIEETAPAIAPVPADIFKKRADRLRSLAPGHVFGKYLDTIALLADAQRMALRVFSAKKEQNIKPFLSFNVRDHSHGKPWRQVLDAIISEMQLAPLPEKSRAALLRLKSAAPAGLEFLAQGMLCGNYDAIDLAASPFVAAALQVYWTDLASRVQTEVPERSSYICPVCGSAPVAGVILSGRKLRYLCCALCSTRWYVPRLTCTNCSSTAGISYYVIDGIENGTKVEACSQCNTYLKLFYLESNPDADPCADDLATLALDLLMSERSYFRRCLNFFFLTAVDDSEIEPI